MITVINNSRNQKEIRLNQEEIDIICKNIVSVMQSGISRDKQTTECFLYLLDACKDSLNNIPLSLE